MNIETEKIMQLHNHDTGGKNVGTICNSTLTDMRMLWIAMAQALRSNDPSTRVGAVITDCYNRIIATGWNGFAIGGQRGVFIAETKFRMENKDIKYPMVVHAEKRAAIDAYSRNAFGYGDGHTLYTYPFMPCATCSAFIIETEKFNRVVTIETNRSDHGFELSREQLSAAQIGLVEFKQKNFFTLAQEVFYEEFSKYGPTNN